MTDVGLKPRHMKKVAVIGGGLMGSGIATALLLSNIRVVIKEINSEYLLKGIKSIEGSHLILSRPYPFEYLSGQTNKYKMVFLDEMLCIDTSVSCFRPKEACIGYDMMK